MVNQGYYLGNGWVKIPKEVRQRAEETARDRWMLLFQLDIVEYGDFELMFGNCGHIYFYITKEDLAAFQVLDNGQNDSGAPQGYAKDSRQVYFHNGDGRVKIIKGAEVSSFRSLGDTYFARDEKRIYAYGKQLPKAELTSWELLGHWYSRDAKRVYYLNREIKGADRDSFTVCTPMDAAPLADHLARDKDHFYQNDEMIDETLWLERLHEIT